LCKTALRLSCFQGNAIEKKFVVGYAEQKTCIPGFGQRLLEFVPRALELTFGAFVSRSIQPGVLNQNIEAVDERAGGRTAAGIGLDRVSDNSLLSDSVIWSRLSGKVTECTITEVIGRNPRPSNKTAPRDRYFWQSGALH
jgi:hypothetical protein